MDVFDYQQDNQGIVTLTMNMTGPVNAMNAEYVPPCQRPSIALKPKQA